MASNTITGQIKKIALDILANSPEGVRYSDLARRILEHNPNFNKNTISGSTWDLEVQFPKDVYKPDRGVFRLVKFKENITTQPDEPTQPAKKVGKTFKEQDFYSLIQW